VCEKVASRKTGGRPSKKTTERGRPKGTSINQLVDHINEIATHSPAAALQPMEVKSSCLSSVQYGPPNRVLVCCTTISSAAEAVGTGSGSVYSV
jgi:hypothetical protein